MMSQEFALGSVTELCDAEIEDSSGEVGKAHSTAAGLVAAEGDASPIFEAGEQVLDVMATDIQLGVALWRIDHVPLGRVWMVQPLAAKSARSTAETEPRSSAASQAGMSDASARA
jgi:hypothetical protein